MIDVAADRLCWSCSPDQLNFESTDELPDLADPIGQDRALEALEFGVGMRRGGYHIYAMGPTGVGKHSILRRMLHQQAAGEAVPLDLAYVHDFDAPERPHALRLPPGRAALLRRDVDVLLVELAAVIPAAFDTTDYREKRRHLEDQNKQQQEAIVQRLRDQAAPRGVAVVATPSGLALAALKDGEPIDDDDFDQLPELEQERLREVIEAVHASMADELRQLPAIDREFRRLAQALDEEVTAFAVALPVAELRRSWEDLHDVVRWLDRVERELIESAERFMTDDDDDDDGRGPGPLSRLPPFPEYRVNVVVDHTGAQGAPVIHEDHPTVTNLVGRIEVSGVGGAPSTDVTRVRAGALHKANGGYLLLDAHRLAIEPDSWDQLKRSLRSGEVRIEPPDGNMSGASTLQPEPVALDLKVILVGERDLLLAMREQDPEFELLFRVAVDFEDDLLASTDNVRSYARWVATLAREERLLPLVRDAVSAVLAQAARLAEDGRRLTLHARSVVELLREADWFARRAGRDTIGTADVGAALAAARRRVGRVRERALAAVLDDIQHIATDGAEVGQINGLSVQAAGGSWFGHPHRISARVWAGDLGVIDIEREVDLSGPLHAKGVLILNGLLGGRYARLPLTLSATLVFEQSYGGVEGDSASLAEGLALLSALADAPLSQAWGVTGSIDQSGNVQAVGGVPEKIEGFFDVCAARGLTGGQGVVVPVANLPHLLLRDDVVEACRQGQFRVVAVRHIDEAFAHLTGLPAGVKAATGSFPADTLNRRVADRLAALGEHGLARRR